MTSERTFLYQDYQRQKTTRLNSSIHRLSKLTRSTRPAGFSFPSSGSRSYQTISGTEPEANPRLHDDKGKRNNCNDNGEAWENFHETAGTPFAVLYPTAKGLNFHDETRHFESLVPVRHSYACKPSAVAAHVVSYWCFKLQVCIRFKLLVAIASVLLFRAFQDLHFDLPIVTLKRKCLRPKFAANSLIGQDGVGFWLGDRRQRRLLPHRLWSRSRRHGEAEQGRRDVHRRGHGHLEVPVHDRHGNRSSCRRFRVPLDGSSLCYDCHEVPLLREWRQARRCSNYSVHSLHPLMDIFHCRLGGADCGGKREQNPDQRLVLYLRTRRDMQASAEEFVCSRRGVHVHHGPDNGNILHTHLHGARGRRGVAVV